MKPANYPEFWHIYLRAHSKPLTRTFHYMGTFLGLGFLCATIYTGNLLLVPAGITAGYALAWFSHFVIEKNKPATFGHPFWSFVSDFRMVGLATFGRLGRHLRDAGTSQPEDHKWKSNCT